MSTPRCVLGLLGPTASGKTELAIKLADRYNLALISVDSAMVYRGLDIGTAKPTSDVLQKYPHALVDIVEPETNFTVSEFIQRADETVQQCFQENKTPLLVGGSMMYFKAFREGISPLPPRDPRFRMQLQERANSLGIPALHAELQSIDPVASSKIHPNNYPRIERALEIHFQTGTPMTTFLEKNAGMPATRRLKCNYFEFALVHQRREEQHEQVKSRLDHMLAAGFPEEVLRLRNRTELTAATNSMRTVGYRQLWEHFDKYPNGAITEATKERILVANRGLVRRQMTWLRNWNSLPNFHQVTTPPTLSSMEARLSSLSALPLGNS